jgi:hypothetical protein
MAPNASDNASKHTITPEERKTLEVEYETAHKDFQGTNSLIWQTFSMVSALALASLAFIGTLKTRGAGDSSPITWPITMGVGFPVIVILLGWLAMMYRWEAYSQVDLYRMRQIESQFGIYRTRYGTWLRKRLDESQLADLSNEERVQYESLIKAFPNFPRYWLRQQVLITSIAVMLIAIWIFAIAADCLSLWK